MKDNFSLKRKGFTLVEIVIVVAIIGILTALAVPNVLRGMNQAKLRQCQSNLYAVDTACQMYFTEHRTWPPIGGLSGSGLDNYFPDNDGNGSGDLPVCPFNVGYSIIADSVTGGVRVDRSTHTHSNE